MRNIFAILFLISIGTAFGNTNCIFDDDGRPIQCIESEYEIVENDLTNPNTQSTEFCVSENPGKCFIAYITANSRVMNIVVESKEAAIFDALRPSPFALSRKIQGSWH